VTKRQYERIYKKRDRWTTNKPPAAKDSSKTG
jgi:hypothetical protein